MAKQAYVRNMYERIALNCDNAEMARSEANKAEDFYSRLAAEIIMHAIADWRELIKKGAWDRAQHPRCNFAELRNFFQSEYCALLMQNFDIEPERLLEVLEKELQEAMKKDEERKLQEEKEHRNKMKGQFS